MESIRRISHFRVKLLNSNSHLSLPFLIRSLLILISNKYFASFKSLELKLKKNFQIFYFGFKFLFSSQFCSLTSPVSFPYINHLIYPVLIYRSYYASGTLSSQIANLLPIMTRPVPTAILSTLQRRPVMKQLQNWVFF